MTNTAHSCTGTDSKRVVIFDLDGTLIPAQSQRLLLKHLRQNGQIGLAPYVRLMFWFVWYRTGLISSPERIMNYAFSFLKGRSAREFFQVAEVFADNKILPMVSAEARRLVRQHQSQGDILLLVSNSLMPVVKRIAHQLGFDRYIATRLEIRKGCFTGLIQGLPVYGRAKAEAVATLIASCGLSLEESVAYCDHDSDLPVLEMVAAPVAVNPASELLKVARLRGWPIITL